MKGLGEKELVIDKKAKGQEIMNKFFEAFRQEEQGRIQTDATDAHASVKILKISMLIIEY